jgi:hypothetical protein
MHKVLLILLLLGGNVLGDGQGLPQPSAIQVHCTPWKVLAGPKVIKDEAGDGIDQETVTFYSAGTVDGLFTQGMKGDPLQAELVICKSHWEGEGKDGFDAADTTYRRYLRVGRSLYYFPSWSFARDDFKPGSEGAAELETLAAYGFTSAMGFERDRGAHVPELEIPRDVKGPEPGQELELVAEVEGGLDLSKVRPAFSHPTLGQVYTTRSDVGASGPFYLYLHPPRDGSKSLSKLRGAGFLATNGFYVFRPDGTFLVYRAQMDWEGATSWLEERERYMFPVDNFATTDGKPFGAAYLCQTKAGCLAEDFSDFCAVQDERAFSQGDLEIYGYITKTARPLYRLKSKNHPLYKSFYGAYLKNFKDWSLSSGPYHKEGVSIELYDHQLTYDEFLDAVPILLFKDPFGRWIRLLHRAFLPPAICEPIVYLYPTRETRVNVKVAPPGGVTRSIPSYAGGWDVLAQPNGRLEDEGSQKKYRCLFWESQSSIFPMRKEGVVVPRDRVKQFLDQTLAQLGLNHLEAEEFEQAWRHKLESKAFCFITFYDADLIDKLAPMEVIPKPDTCIRVLMDYKALDAPITVPALPPFPKIERHGFTVVEWGGMER